MKNLAYIFPCLLFSITSFSQVGINTTTPTTTLDVNGNIRVRDLSNRTGLEAVKVIGIDEKGHFVEVSIGKNIDLIDNRLVVTDRTQELGDNPTPLTGSQTDNLRLAVLPGEPNYGKSIIRIIRDVPGDTEITGFEAAPDGTHIWLYAVDGKLKLIDNSTDSLPENRIELNSKMDVKQYEMIELFYDGNRKKWIIMSHD